MFSTGSDDSGLKYQLDRIEAKLDLLLQHAGIDVPVDALELEVRALMNARQSIAALKLVRSRTGMGLKEAKDWMERL
jgi:ribosomal protein L7/L12